MATPHHLRTRGAVLGAALTLLVAAVGLTYTLAIGGRTVEAQAGIAIQVSGKDGGRYDPALLEINTATAPVWMPRTGPASSLHRSKADTSRQ